MFDFYLTLENILLTSSYLTAQLNFINRELIIIKYIYLSFENSGSTTQRLCLFLSKFQWS